MYWKKRIRRAKNWWRRQSEKWEVHWPNTSRKKKKRQEYMIWIGGKILEGFTRIFVLNLTISLLATIFFFDVVPDLLLRQRFEICTLNASFFFWIHVNVCPFYGYLLQTDGHKTFARTCFTYQYHVFTHASFREILDQVLLLTVEAAVDLGNGLLWGQPKVSCLWPVTLVHHLKVPFALHAVVFCACELLKLVRVVFCICEPAGKFDFRLVSNERTEKNGDPYFLRKLSLAGTETHFFFTELVI